MALELREITELTPDVIRGARLFGNDLLGKALVQWFEDERDGYYNLSTNLYGNDQSEENFDHRAMNLSHARMLGRSNFSTCLALGCASGEDIRSLGILIGKIIAIEPGREWWCPRIGSVPAEFREPNIDGKIDLPDGSVDLVVALGTLHHIANVEFVISELARVLAPGGRFLIREPVISMGDFTRPRPGLTRHERGIPASLMRQFIRSAGLQLTEYRFCSFNPLRSLVTKLVARPYNSGAIVIADKWLSAMLAWNVQYWRRSFFEKLAPSSAAYTGFRP